MIPLTLIYYQKKRKDTDMSKDLDPMELLELAGETAPMLEEDWYRQNNLYDCGVCCLAYVTSRATETVLDKFQHRPEEYMTGELEKYVYGTGVHEMIMYLLKHSTIFPVYFQTREQWKGMEDTIYSLIAADEKVMMLSSDEVKKEFLNERNSAILSVPSKELEGEIHWIVWDAGKIFDPAWTDRYESLDEVVVKEVILLK
jgi:hypothetical protein